MRDTAGSAAAPAARCRKFRRGSFMRSLPIVFTVPQLKCGDRKDLPLETRIQFSHLYANALKFPLAARAARSALRAATSAKVHCQATSGSLPSPPEYLTNISPAGSPIERRTAEALRRRSRTSAAKPGLAKYCVRSTIIVALVGITVPCPNADADGTTGSAAAPAARCRKFRRGSFILNPPSAARLSVRVPWQPHGEHRTF